MFLSIVIIQWKQTRTNGKSSKCKPMAVTGYTIASNSAFKQLAGHGGRFKTVDHDGYILKEMDHNEIDCYNSLKGDSLEPFTPHFDREVNGAKANRSYGQIRNLLAGFTNPSIMDIKIGTRSFLEVEVNNNEMRSDLYEKLVANDCLLDNTWLTNDEKLSRKITKYRYMSWRDESTSTKTLGFRIESISTISEEEKKELFYLKDENEIKNKFKKFANVNTIMNYLTLILKLSKELAHSQFFSTHEFIGSSLLFVHDNEKANIWLIDFGKTIMLPENVKITHNLEWSKGNHEDGYLIGIQNLIKIFQDLIKSNEL